LIFLVVGSLNEKPNYRQFHTLDRGPFKSSRVNTLAWVWGYDIHHSNTLHTADSRFSLRTQKSRRSVQRTQVCCCDNDTESRVRKIKKGLKGFQPSKNVFLKKLKIQSITSSHETDITNCVCMILRDLRPPVRFGREACLFSKKTDFLKNIFQVGRVITVIRTRTEKSHSCQTLK